MTDIPETEKAWAAGFFDGEGSISFLKVGGAKKGHHYLCVSISNINTNGIQRVGRWFGGRVYFEQSRQCSRWVARSRVAEAFLAAIKPYVCQKLEAIEIAEAFQATVGRRGTRVISPAHRAERITLRERLRAANARD